MSTPAGDGTPPISITDMMRPLPEKVSAPTVVEAEPESDEAPAGVPVRQLVIWCGPPLVVAGGVGLALVSTWALVIGLVVAGGVGLAAWRWRHQLANLWSATSTSGRSGGGAGGGRAGGWGWGGGRPGAGGRQAGGLLGRFSRNRRGAGAPAGGAGARQPGRVRRALTSARQALTPAGIKQRAQAAATGAKSLWKNTKAKAKAAGQRAAAKLIRRPGTSTTHGAGGAAGGKGSRWRPGRRRPGGAGGGSTSAGGGKGTSTTSAGGKDKKKTTSTTSAGDAGAPAGAGAGECVLDGDDSHDWEREPRYFWRRTRARAGDAWFKVATAVGDEVRAGASGRVITALKKPFEGLIKRKPPVDEAEPAPVIEAPAAEPEPTVWRMPTGRLPVTPRYIEPSTPDHHTWRYSDAADVPKPRTSADATVSAGTRSGGSAMSSGTLEALVPKLKDESTVESKVRLLTETAEELRKKAAAKEETAENLDATARSYDEREGFQEKAEEHRVEATKARNDAETYIGEAKACDDTISELTS